MPSDPKPVAIMERLLRPAALFAETYETTWQRLQGWDQAELRGDEFTLAEDITPFLADPATAGVK